MLYLGDLPGELCASAQRCKGASSGAPILSAIPASDSAGTYYLRRPLAGAE